MINKELPLAWMNISIDEYIELQDAVLDNDEQLEKEEIILREIQILYHEDPLTMDLPKYKKCIQSLRFMAQPIPKMKIKDSYNLGGNIYYLHKKLEQFKVGQYVDYQRIMQEKKGVEAYPDFIALFLTPDEDGVYGDGYDVAQVISDVRQYMSIADATSIAGFFLHLCQIYIALSHLYLYRKTRKMIKDRKTRKQLKKKTMQLINLLLSGGYYH